MCVCMYVGSLANWKQGNGKIELRIMLAFDICNQAEIGTMTTQPRSEFVRGLLVNWIVSRRSLSWEIFKKNHC